MAGLTITVRSVDGTMRKFPIGQHKLQELAQLQRQGLTGKTLIHEWLTDDWGAPPIYIDVQGIDADGKKADIRLLYN